MVFHVMPLDQLCQAVPQGASAASGCLSTGKCNFKVRWLTPLKAGGGCARRLSLMATVPCDERCNAQSPLKAALSVSYALESFLMAGGWLVFDNGQSLYTGGGESRKPASASAAPRPASEASLYLYQGHLRNKDDEKEA